jgi:hypothetical protein
MAHRGSAVRQWGNISRDHFSPWHIAKVESLEPLRPARPFTKSAQNKYLTLRLSSLAFYFGKSSRDPNIGSLQQLNLACLGAMVAASLCGITNRAGQQVVKRRRRVKVA